MTIKELKLRLNEFNENNFISSTNPKNLKIYDPENEYSYFIQIEKSQNTEELTHEENIQYLKMCLGIVYGEKTFDLKTVDMFISLFQLIDKKKGETDLQSICEIIKDVQYRFENKKS
jgi:hypothetical protein